MRIVYFSPALDNILTPGKTIAAQVNPQLRQCLARQGKPSAHSLSLYLKQISIFYSRKE